MYKKDHKTWEREHVEEAVLVWCREAFNRNNPEAMFLLADQMLAEADQGKSTAEAVYKMEWAAKHDYPLAALSMGQMFHFGWAVHADEEEARTWYEKALALGCVEAETWLKLLDKEGILEEAEKNEERTCVTDEANLGDEGTDESGDESHAEENKPTDLEDTDGPSANTQKTAQMKQKMIRIGVCAGSVVVLLMVIVLICVVVKVVNSGEEAEAGVIVSDDTELITPATVEEFNAALTDLIAEYDGTLVVSGEQNTNRLLLQFEGEGIDLSAFPAATVIADGDNYVVIQFENEEDAAACLEALKNMDEVLFVEEDQYNGYTDGEYTDSEVADGDDLEKEDDGTNATDVGNDEKNSGTDKTDAENDEKNSDADATGAESWEESDSDDGTAYATALGSYAVYTSSYTGFSYYSWGVEFMGMDQLAAWIMTQNTFAVTVAVIDSGVEPCADTEDRILDGTDLVASGGNGQNDENGHGTHVASTIIDCTQGLDISILPIRALNADGAGTDSAIVQGLKYAIDQGADVINMSLGSSRCSDLEDYYIDKAIEAGIVVVVAAGNGDDYGNPVDTVNECPAHLEECIVVAACDSSGTIASFSNYGESVDVAAPGVQILSNYIGDNLAYLDGTSMATPHVAALAAMLKSYLRDKTSAQIEKYIKDYCIDMGNEMFYGDGIPWAAYFAGD